jgi:CubicO group peptidase (beta-lactamase class C family)
MRRFAPYLLLCGLAFGQSNAGLEQLVSATVERARKEFNVPGISVAVVKDGKVALAKGYGVRSLTTKEPMTERTLVAIASNTKAFTSAALAMLVDEGKLSWDDRVIDRLPEFAMSDAYVTREMRIRDLPCHRSGLPLGAGDLLWWPASDLTSAEVLYRLRFVPLKHGFRERYDYDNVLYNVMGAVVERVSGQPWDEFIRERFFKPLGMTTSLTSVRQLARSMDAAMPHAPSDGVLKELPHSPLDSVAPAGSLVSSAFDMTKWVATLLNKGVTPDGKRLLSEAQVKTLWTPLIFVPQSPPPPELQELKANFAAYAMGEGISEYRGHLTVSHSGGLLGMVTFVTMIPDRNLGVIVLTNQQEGDAFLAVKNTILDHYLNAPGKDWVTAFGALRKKELADAAKTMGEASGKRNADSKPSLPLASYAGRYRDAWYGDVQITGGDRLQVRFSHTPALTGTLEHFQYDTFIVRWNDRSLDADAYVTFSLDESGSIADIRMKAVSPLTDFSFNFHDLHLKPVAPNAPAY